MCVTCDAGYPKLDPVPAHGPRPQPCAEKLPHIQTVTTLV